MLATAPAGCQGAHLDLAQRGQEAVADHRVGFPICPPDGRWHSMVSGRVDGGTPPEDIMMHKTKNDLPEKVRTQVVGLLQERLADCIDLAQQAKQAHWNVKGPSFIALHELFDKVYEHAQEHTDLIA